MSILFKLHLASHSIQFRMIRFRMILRYWIASHYQHPCICSFSPAIYTICWINWFFSTMHFFSRGFCHFHGDLAGFVKFSYANRTFPTDSATWKRWNGCQIFKNAKEMNFCQRIEALLKWKHLNEIPPNTRWTWARESMVENEELPASTPYRTPVQASNWKREKKDRTTSK